MTSHPPKNHRTRRDPRRRIAGFVAAGALGLFAAVGIAVSAADQDTASRPSIVETGEITSMGMPLIETPGAATGSMTAGPVEVTGASWELGTVPLDVAVRPTWTLHNTGTDAVLVGEPHPEVRDGCCPGTFSIDTTTIAPGETATLGFELSMHAGMDGWHDIAVHVPLRSGTTDHVLALDVTGDFSNT
jgi:hypothetical protein